MFGIEHILQKFQKFPVFDLYNLLTSYKGITYTGAGYKVHWFEKREFLDFFGEIYNVKRSANEKPSLMGR